ncbi:MAG: large subunit ribosomal protein L10, partial [Saprospiraceae bacterium]
MTRADKSTAIESLKQDFENNKFFYIADSSSMSVADINRLRRMCFEKGVQVKVVKNT